MRRLVFIVRHPFWPGELPLAGCLLIMQGPCQARLKGTNVQRT